MSLASKSLTAPVPKEHHDVKYRYSRVADIILKIGWETNTSHAECGQLNRAVNIYCRLYWAHALIRRYLRTGRKYALNKHMRLLTRLYSSSIEHQTMSTLYHSLYKLQNLVLASIFQAKITQFIS